MPAEAPTAAATTRPADESSADTVPDQRPETPTLPTDQASARGDGEEHRGAAQDRRSEVIPVAEMAEIGLQAYVACDVAAQVVERGLPPGERLAAWRRGMHEEGVEHPAVMEALAVVDALRPELYPRVAAAMTELLRSEWQCEDLAQMLDVSGESRSTASVAVAHPGAAVAFAVATPRLRLIRSLGQ